MVNGLTNKYGMQNVSRPPSPPFPALTLSLGYLSPCRGHVLEDGLAALGSGGRAERQTKRRLCVFYVGAAGHEESGIDMGGLFKDFWTDLSALAFDVNYGLFRCGIMCER